MPALVPALSISFGEKKIWVQSLGQTRTLMSPTGLVRVGPMHGDGCDHVKILSRTRAGHNKRKLQTRLARCGAEYPNLRAQIFKMIERARIEDVTEAL
jgi:hypothetical protein